MVPTVDSALLIACSQLHAHVYHAWTARRASMFVPYVIHTVLP